MKSQIVQIDSLPDTRKRDLETKDPSIVPLPDGHYMLFYSLGRSDIETWEVGRAISKSRHPAGPYQELPPAKIFGVNGKQVCAPAVTLKKQGKQPVFEMHVQENCFEPDGSIAVAHSYDGENFYGAAEPAIKIDDLPGSLPYKVSALYDAGNSVFNYEGKLTECMAFSGYRGHVGCGDVYVTMRDLTKPGAKWKEPRLILSQEDVPFHNQPGKPGYEWGLEGAKIEQITDDCYVTPAVCFLDKPGHEHFGTRQRMFLAAGKSPMDKFVPVAIPFEPIKYGEKSGENGHPDTVDLGDRLGIMYQERQGAGHPWHFRYGEVNKGDIVEAAKKPMLSYPMPGLSL